MLTGSCHSSLQSFVICDRKQNLFHQTKLLVVGNMFFDKQFTEKPGTSFFFWNFYKENSINTGGCEDTPMH